MNIKEHYDNHLGNFYSWMLGDFDQRQAEQEEYFRRNNIYPHINKIALDLGAGNGIQSVSLAKLGFEVKAIEFCQQLSQELTANSKGLNVELFPRDFSIYESLTDFNPELTICMGDTITHLSSVENIVELVSVIYKISVNKSLFIVSFRDVTNELKAEQRFIPVKSDRDRIHTCFLEFFTEYVTVSDILYEKKNENWNLKISNYKKLRLNVDTLRNAFARNNFHLMHMEMIKGMTYLIFEKKQ